ncbi:uncharacterized protein K489DRAFT_165075 [Dissoconium aciculare CBS 342.82]|uniref:Uncharacterized protein n=1 Tax=Dissoconium aciculare CBS 342.82 TaxID=1314786 RepID=A0A6J3MCD7_9PEZI|nr:uncharacterized protein K489DRAFT_165075 [Dissoconium aciculare CBS 342.82]KAF1825685.1 hypothetical protein K489DRAFT_165075 [Dissoconium aciculare CBS 342.82]
MMRWRRHVSRYVSRGITSALVESARRESISAHKGRSTLYRFSWRSAWLVFYTIVPLSWSFVPVDYGKPSRESSSLLSPNSSCLRRKPPTQDLVDLFTPSH